jgi:cell division protein ZapA (FtsZ GTPase activity inhibitor)
MLIDNLANLKRSTRNIVFTALIIIATIAMYDWIVAPHVTCLSASQRYDSVVSKAVEKNEAVARDVATKTKRLEELYRQLAESRSTLFTPDEAKAFFSDLQAVSEETGCTVHSLNLVVSGPSSGNKQKQSEDTSGIVANSATLTVSGQYNSIIRLVEKLQNHAKRIWMNSFKMETIDFGSAQLKCDMTITIYTIQDKGAAL